MVYRGPSKGCGNCRKRRVKCDEQRPACGNCTKRKITCVGYRKDSDKDDPTSVVTNVGKVNQIYTDSDAHLQQRQQRYSDISSDSDQSERSLVLLNGSQHSPYLEVVPNLSTSLEPTALAYFFANYVTVPKDPTTNIYVNHIMPLVKKASIHSSLSRAVSAVALNLAGAWTYQGWDAFAARKSYTESIKLLQQEIQDPEKVMSDEILAAAFMLDFYEMLSRRWLGGKDLGVHSSGAMALIRHRAGSSFKSGTAKRLLTALRHRCITYAIQNKIRVDIDPYTTEESTTDLPSAQLDLLTAEFADFQADFFDKFDDFTGSLRAPNPVHQSFETLLRRAIALETKFKAWRLSLPVWWQPYIMPDPAKELHPSIRSAGIYQDRCTVYSSLPVGHALNVFRVHYITILRILKYCASQIPKSPLLTDKIAADTIDQQMQILADEICASVPFFLGSRTTFSLPYEHQHYPKIPDFLKHQTTYTDAMGDQIEMTDEYFMQAAVSIGGWFIMVTLTSLMKSIKRDTSHPQSNVLNPIALRAGQKEWIGSQLWRLTNIYHFQLPRSFLHKIKSAVVSIASSGSSN